MRSSGSRKVDREIKNRPPPKYGRKQTSRPDRGAAPRRPSQAPACGDGQAFIGCSVRQQEVSSDDRDRFGQRRCSMMVRFLAL
jgi:hypothetical protein